MSGNPGQDFLYQALQKGVADSIIRLSDLTVDKRIGQGASAEVWKGTYKGTDVGKS